nr:CinA family nicotinamide mononucleotide deamidase-related protein [Anaerolineae bacterium]
MRAELVTIGTELLLGEIDDTNATYIARQLSEIGLDLIYRTTVGDNEQRIAEAIAIALNRVDIVITTGGLGPTIDDKTREGIAAATGRRLVFDPDLLDQIASRFVRFNVSMSDNNRKQAYIPEGAVPIENAVGTAPIFVLSTEQGTVMVLPGVPREMKHLLHTELIPLIERQSGRRATIHSLTLRTAGIGESQIDDLIGDLMTASNPTIGLAAHTGQTDIRITAKAGTVELAKQLIAPVEKEIRSRLGTWIYADGDALIEEVVAKLLVQNDIRVGVIEHGSGGILCERLQRSLGNSHHLVTCLADVPGINLRLLTGLTFEEMTIQSAKRARDEANADYGLALLARTHDQNAEDNDTGTALAVVSDNSRTAHTYRWMKYRTDADIWLSTHALAQLRRMILKSKEGKHS